MTRAELTRLAKCMAWAAWSYNERGQRTLGRRGPRYAANHWTVWMSEADRKRWLRAARLATAQTQRKAKR
jgi:hypothetical protein